MLNYSSSLGLSLIVFPFDKFPVMKIHRSNKNALKTLWQSEEAQSVPAEKRSVRLVRSGTGSSTQHWFGVMCNSIERVTTGTQFVPPSTWTEPRFLVVHTRARIRTHVQGVPDLRRRWTHTHIHTHGSQLERLGQVFISRSHPRPQDLLPLENVARSATDFQNSSWKHLDSRHLRGSCGSRRIVDRRGTCRESDLIATWGSLRTETYLEFFVETTRRWAVSSIHNFLLIFPLSLSVEFLQQIVSRVNQPELQVSMPHRVFSSISSRVLLYRRSDVYVRIWSLVWKYFSRYSKINGSTRDRAKEISIRLKFWYRGHTIPGKGEGL